MRRLSFVRPVVALQTFGLAFCLWLGVRERLPGEEPRGQTREFAVFVDGKPCGQYALAIRRHEDGSQVISGEADIRVKVIGFTAYRYSSRGSETWKRGRLEKLENTANYNGQQYAVKAVIRDDRLRVQVNNQEQDVAPEVWTTSYWQLPDPKRRNQPLVLFDCDKGRDIAAVLQHVGQEQITVGERRQSCAHYKVRGGVEVDLWYDDQERLVRQEAVESGHRALLQLTRIGE